MERVDFLMKNGKTRLMYRHQAEALRRAGMGTYETRDMARQPMIAPVLAPVALGDGYDLMTREQLFALAKERGITVPGASGTDKVRAALRA